MNRLLFLLIFTVLTMSAISYTQQLYAQEKNWTIATVPADSLQKWQERYAVSKIIPKEFELPAYIALAHYPELNNTRIIFKKRKIAATMAAAPRWDFIFRPRHKRTYIISIAADSIKRKAILPIDIPLSGQVGVMGHELGHIFWYEQKGVFPILRFGLGQLSKKFRERTEKETDQTTIEHGLCRQLYDLRVCTNITSNPPPAYKAMKELIYMTPEEIGEQCPANEDQD